MILDAVAALGHVFDGGEEEGRGAKTSVILTKKLRSKSKSTNLFKLSVAVHSERGVPTIVPRGHSNLSPWGHVQFLTGIH